MSNYNQISAWVFKIVLCTEGFHQIYIKDIICNKDKTEYYLIFEVLDDCCNDIALNISVKRRSPILENIITVLELNLENSFNGIVNKVIYAVIIHNSKGYQKYADIDTFLTNEEADEYLNCAEDEDTSE